MAGIVIFIAKKASLPFDYNVLCNAKFYV